MTKFERRCHHFKKKKNVRNFFIQPKEERGKRGIERNREERERGRDKEREEE